MSKAGFFGLIILLFIYRSIAASAQDTSQLKAATAPDSIALSKELSEVVVHAYEESKRITDQSAPVFFLSGSDLSRFGNTDILPAINTVPGVRMEQRSPASYRLNIRGSSLRAPFGVREVKIYYNGIPVTDPSGDTYLNQFSFSDIGSAEIIKGPAGSIYGAGTGGVLLLHSGLAAAGADSAAEAGIGYHAGSYGSQGMNAYLKWGDTKTANRISYSGAGGSGYRDHTAMHQKTMAYELSTKISGKQEFNFIAHYNDLYYQTPGALTLKEFTRDPRAARPASGSLPSAADSHAAVYQKNLLIGMNQSYHFTDRFENTTSLYGEYTDLINPTFRNYEYRKEPHFGGRTVFKYHFPSGGDQSVLLAGAELQQGYFAVKDFGNKQGAPDTLQTDYHVNNFRALLFVQADISLAGGWDITAGAGLNFSRLQFLRLNPSPAHVFNRNFSNNLMPRLALLKKLPGDIAVYVSAAQGFSPPSVSELLPSTSVLNTALQPEKGTDLEIGSRGYLWGHKLYYDVDGFLFNPGQSISQRRDSSGADYFVNAGGELQHGAEGYVLYRLIDRDGSFLQRVDIFTSQTWFHFRYKNYKVINNDYSGNPVPGVAPYTSVTGLDLATRPRIAMHITWNYSSRMPLNDAGSAYAPVSNLLNITLGYQHDIARACSLEISAGVDNLLNATYSLGDDINAAGGRYYNAAPGISYYGSIALKLKL